MDRDAMIRTIRDCREWPAEAILDVIAPAIRAAALEEAAQLAEDHGYVEVMNFAFEIRTLINAPPTTP
jgi:hypothetical protein